MNLAAMKKSLFRITSLNFNGIRSAAAKGMQAWVEKTAPDCMCVQEIKAQAADIAGKFEQIAGMQGYFNFAEKKGYSGVGVYTRHAPSQVIIGFDGDEFDAEGRYVELRFDTPARKFSVISSYFPSGSSGEDRQLAKYRFLAKMAPHLAKLKAQREFVLCGDINIAHQEADLKNYKGNVKNSGFLPEERAWMTQLLARNSSVTAAVKQASGAAGATLAIADTTQVSSHASTTGCGLVDVYRLLQPDTTDTCYTWWSQRGQAYTNNVGWRLDYHLATPAIAALARAEEIYKTEKFSDHAPITVGYDMRL